MNIVCPKYAFNKMNIVCPKYAFNKMNIVCPKYIDLLYSNVIFYNVAKDNLQYPKSLHSVQYCSEKEQSLMFKIDIFKHLKGLAIQL